MKIAFISDIHANLEALEATLKDIDGIGVDEVTCLGDVVGYGVNPNECVEIVRKRCGRNVILGNHDAVAVGLHNNRTFNVHAKIAIEWTANTLSVKNKHYLAALPTMRVGKHVTLAHATPHDPGAWYYITSLEEAAFNFQFFDTDICVVGHTHIPKIILMNDNEILMHNENEATYGGSINQRLLVNAGSVGQPRDRDKNSSYGILDTEKKTFAIRRVPYDIAKTQVKMKKQGMPDFLINRLSEGR